MLGTLTGGPAFGGGPALGGGPAFGGGPALGGGPAFGGGPAAGITPALGGGGTSITIVVGGGGGGGTLITIVGGGGGGGGTTLGTDGGDGLDRPKALPLPLPPFSPKALPFPFPPAFEPGGGPTFGGGPAPGVGPPPAIAGVAFKDDTASAAIAQAQSNAARPPTRARSRPLYAQRTTALLSPLQETRLSDKRRLDDQTEPELG